MGELDLSASGKIYLDSNVFIYSVERLEPCASLLQPVWEAAAKQEISIYTSELTLLETLVKPLRDEDEVLVDLFRRLLSSREVNLIPTTAKLWEDSASIRARWGLKTPDAVHAASAATVEASWLLTNDPHFRRFEEVPVVILSDLT